MFAGLQSVQGISRNDFHTSLEKYDFCFFFEIPGPVERFSVRISAENHVLLVLESHMVHNRSKTTCNLPGTLVGHSKITISLLNSAWFARYSGFQLPALIDPPLFVSITTDAPL